MNVANVALLSVWDKYKDLRLVYFPKDHDLPMSIQSFESIQKDTIAKTREILTKKYLFPIYFY